jgi:uncharacterized protein YndB with AHSA1/START domain
MSKSPARTKRKAGAKKAAVARKRRVGGARAPARKAAPARKRKAARKKAAPTGKAGAAGPASTTGMLIRRPVAEVFHAFINPDITSKFWFSKGTGKLEVGKQVHWEWEMYGFAIPVTAKTIEPNERIVIEWPGYKNVTTVEWTFKPLDDGSTFVRISESGFAGTGNDLTKRVANSAEGFSLMLAGLKALLEHNINLNLIGDRFPKGIER